MIKNSIRKQLHRRGYNFELAKEKWRGFCEHEDNSIPLYYKTWYWDCVCDEVDDWWVILVEDKYGDIEAAFPFLYQYRKGMYYIETPWQVAVAGIWIKKSYEGNKLKGLQALDRIVEYVIEMLPKYDKFSIVFDSQNLWTWHPFYWRGFSCSPTYTMVITNLEQGNEKGYFSKKKREELNRTERLATTSFEKTSLDDYWELLVESYEHRGRILNYKKERFYNLINTALEHDSAWICGVYENEELIAGNICLVDANCVYNHFGCYDTKTKIKAESFAIYTSICRAVSQNKRFDFEGSMIRGVSVFNFSFDPELELRYHIESFSYKYRTLSDIWKIWEIIKNRVTSRLGSAAL